MHLRKSSGFSLLESLLALGIMGVGVYFIVGLLKTGSMGQKTLLAQDDARVLTDNMANMLSDPAACQATFAGLDPVSGASVARLKDKAGNVQFKVGERYGNRGVELASLTVGGPGNDPRTRVPKWASGTIANTGTAFVSVDWLQTGHSGSQGSGPSHLLRYFMVYVTTLDPSGSTIVKCTAQIGGGEVYGSGTPRFLALWKDDGTLGPSSLAYEASNGNLGIARTSPSVKLDVGGGIRPGTEAQAGNCSSSVEGQIRYNSSSHAMEYCGGSPLAWQSFGPSPGTAGAACTTPGFPNNTGVVMYNYWGGGRVCCGNGSGNGFVNAPHGVSSVHCEPF